MADIAVENEATTVAPVVEKEVEEVSTPKVAAEDTEVVGNGTSAAKVGDEAAEAVPTPAEASENGQKTPAADEAVAADATAESKPAENTEESAEKEADTVESEQKNGSSTDAPAEAVKRKVNDVAEETPAADIADSIPEKKAKIAAEKEAETNGEVPKEEVAA